MNNTYYRFTALSNRLNSINNDRMVFLSFFLWPQLYFEFEIIYSQSEQKKKCTVMSLFSQTMNEHLQSTDRNRHSEVRTFACVFLLLLFFLLTSSCEWDLRTMWLYEQSKMKVFQLLWNFPFFFPFFISNKLRFENMFLNDFF